MSTLKIAKRFRSEQECFDFLFKKRWGKEAKCAYCGGSNISVHKEEKQRDRLQCSGCRKSFSVTVGTIFEDTKLSLIKWFTAIAIMVEAKKGISALQLSRHLDVNYRTAWSISYKIRRAMTENNLEKFGGIVEMDETYIKTDNDDEDKNGGRGKKARSQSNTPVVAIAKKGGSIKAFATRNIMASTLYGIARRNIKEESEVHTDSAATYNSFPLSFKHKKVKHAVEFVSKEGVHCNTAESFWGDLKRGI